MIPLEDFTDEDADGDDDGDDGDDDENDPIILPPDQVAAGMKEVFDRGGHFLLFHNHPPSSPSCCV